MAINTISRWVGNGAVRALGVLIGCLALAVFFTYVLYGFTEDLLKERLRERIVSIVATGATQINPVDLNEIWTPEDIEKKSAKRVVSHLKNIRDASNDIRFAYILRRGDSTNNYSFIIDSESLDSKEEQEKRAGQELAEDELAPQPGDEFDVSAYPALRDEAFYNPVAEDELQKDQWSTQLSAYAPIRDGLGSTVGILGIDVVVDAYLENIQATFLPFLLFVLFLISLLTLLSLLLIRFAGERLKILQELDRQKDGVLHMVAHQLRGPVTNINYITEFLLDGTYGMLSNEQRDNIQSIRSASLKMGAQSEMVLDAAKIRSGQLPFDPKPLDLHALFKEAIEEAEIRAKDKKVNLIIKLPSKKLPTANLDRRYTQLVIDNLLSNAIKYSALKAEGSDVELMVAIENNKLICSVKDSGIGIPLKDQGHIFKELYRASNSGKEGNGLGLNVAKGAIEGQGGRIWFNSKEGVGTTFSFELPLRS